MPVSAQPSAIGDSVKEITGDACPRYDKQLIARLLKHDAFSQPTVSSEAFNFNPCIGIWKIEIGDINGAWR